VEMKKEEDMYMDFDVEETDTFLNLEEESKGLQIHQSSMKKVKESDSCDLPITKL